MKRRLMLWMGVSAVLVVCAQSQANLVAGDEIVVTIENDGGYVSPAVPPGGPFRITAAGSSTFDTFLSFCVEMDAKMKPFDTVVYHVANIGTATDGTPSRSLTDMTAWLYTTFLDNRSSLVAYSDDQLQYAVWRTMGYTESDITTAHTVAFGYETEYGELQGLYGASGWTDPGNVRIANLVFVNSLGAAQARQDILMRLSVVPAPGASALAVVGFSLLGLRRRHFA